MSSVLDEPKVVSDDLCLDPEALQKLLRRPEISVHEQLARELGIGHPGAVPPMPYPSAEEAAQLFPEWAGFRLEAWRAFLPTTYPQKDWARYDYVNPDEAVMQSIVRARDTGVFEKIEIWTDEPDHYVREFRDLLWDGWNGALRLIGLDPVAVGIVDNRVFPIVRWGTEELVPERTVMRVGGFRAIRKRLIGP